MTAEHIKDNEWIVTDDAGIKHRVFCRANENTAEAAIAVIVELQTQEAE
jgi:hypothetical protein